MAALDFKEIPEAHLGGGLQDTFELFARDFLTLLGYEILEGPSRGADGGKDLIAVERRRGVGGETVVRWLVSCKHKAHSGASVNPADESNIRDRVEANGCNGFVGFYSTLPSSGLSDAIAGLSTKVETQIFDRERIESYLLKGAEGLHVAKRYFPKSMTAWMGENPKPAKIFSTHPCLTCHHCGKDLLNPVPAGIIVIWQRRDIDGKKHVDTVYWCCKGNCDRRLGESQRGKGLIDGWEDIPDVAIPLVFAKWVMVTLNEFQAGDTYSPLAFDRLKEFILSIYPYVARHPTESEIERMEGLMRIPAALGGLGY
ncbi:restriction endonuclease [Bradyrhizobium cenepequi]|uniref:restriction endonuclease n=1 Tax=Bradyrhizobium cenepequi TaxID=2821403 RepID=UPI001CE32580|nr:restriction endonuclease [Bradyrhizobium cenepequi]MCA6111943.1 restriction endonuclease [Bradyrhizobium cenepequi]